MDRRALTRRDVVVVIVVVVLLGSLLVSSLVSPRERYRASCCLENLRQFGIGLMRHAESDSETRLCSGAYDWQHDGCPDTVGWVADLVNDGFCRPIDMLCPSINYSGRDIKALWVLSDLYARNFGERGVCGAGPEWIDRSLANAGVCGKDDALGDRWTPTRRRAIEEHILNKGYSTNYTAHWYLVRGNPRVKVADVKPVGGKADGFTVRLVNPLSGDQHWPTWKPRKQNGVEISTGPLRRRDLQASKIASEMIPLLADSAPGDPDYSVLDTDLNYRNQKLLLAGDWLAESFGEGPSTWSWNLHRIAPVPGDAIVGQVTGFSIPSPQWSGQLYEEWMGNGYGSVGLQNTKNITCYHAGFSGSHFCPLLMADGSVRDVLDIDNDGYLNPGFRVNDWGQGRRAPAPFWDANNPAWPAFWHSCGMVDAPCGSPGYFGPTEDLPRTEVFSGLFITNPLPSLPGMAGQ